MLESSDSQSLHLLINNLGMQPFVMLERLKYRIAFL